MSREYDTAPPVAMGIGREYDLDRGLYVSFTKLPVLDQLLSYGWGEGPEKFTLSGRHPRFKELQALGRIDGEDPDAKGMFLVAKTDSPTYVEREFVQVIRRGEDPADVMSNLPVLLLCEHPAGRRCPITSSGMCLKNRFRDRYDAWKLSTDSELLEGVPLSEAPFINSGWRETLLHRNVRSVEQLAALDADVVGTMPGLSNIQARAVEYLASTKDKRGRDQLRAELTQRDERIAALEARLTALAEKQEKPAARHAPGRAPSAR